MDELIYNESWSLCGDYEIVLSALLIVETSRLAMQKIKDCWCCSARKPPTSVEITPKSGLQNLGNTCYFNSVVQCLFMCDRFRHRVLQGSNWADANSLHGQLKAVFHNLTAQKGSVSPHIFLQNTRPPWFDEGCQQDSSEFLRYVLELLHEDEQSKRPKEVPRSVNSTKGLPRSFREMLPWFSNDHEENQLRSTLVEELFVGEMENTYTCGDCSSKYSSKQPFYDLTLHFPSALNDGPGQQQQGFWGLEKKYLKLQDLFQEYFKVERLEGEGQFFCKSCDNLQDANKTVRVTQFPEVLILSIARFSYDMETCLKSKRQNTVMYPKILKLGSNQAFEEDLPIPEESATVYGLTGVIVHMGSSLNHGHYFCFGTQAIPVRTQGQVSSDVFVEDWYKFNDTHVSHIGDFSKVKAASFDSAYILFYTKV